MKYYSTRDKAVGMESAQAIQMGLSRDGGLLTPEVIPQIDRAFLESLVGERYQVRAATVSYTHLDVYKRQPNGRIPPVSVPLPDRGTPDAGAAAL